MIVLVQPIFADAVLNGLALFAFGFVGYLYWLRVSEKRRQQKEQRQRERDRQKHWGYV